VRILLTGAAGFLGWHTRARLRALSDHTVLPVTRANWSSLPDLVGNADAILHIAGVNRGRSVEVEHGNLALARDVAAAVRSCGTTPAIVYSNSIHAGSDTPYGIGKEGAAGILRELADEIGSWFSDVRLPNLFGEHGRPDYNSFVATFVDCLVRGERPPIIDRSVELLHVQAAAEHLIGGLAGVGGSPMTPRAHAVTVAGVYEQLCSFDRLYATGDLPPLPTDFDVDLFNTYRAACFPGHYPMPLTQRSDERGALIEVVRAHGGQGQTFASTTRPGITRGEHFHLRKIERFVVIAGQATISLRRLFDDVVVTYEVDGEKPALVDMPTMWAHNLTNTGPDDLVTLFWTHELFDPDCPDTYPEMVGDPCSR